MKKLLYFGFSISTLLFFSSLSNPTENKLLIQSKDIKLPDWQWSSGQVEMKKIASKQSFSLIFDPAIYHPRDSIKITISSFKVAITNLGNKKSFGQWQGVISLDYFINNNWIPLVEDSIDRLNMPFSNKNNVPEDSIKDYSLYFTVPLTRTLTITASAISYEVDNDSSLPISGKGGPALITSIRGIEIKKLR
jgi:hypothetical protein